MNELLKEFYSEDCSYKSLSSKDQAELFKAWASRKGMNAELEFSISKKHLVLFLIFAALYISSFFTYSIPKVSKALMWAIGPAGVTFSKIKKANITRPNQRLEPTRANDD